MIRKAILPDDRYLAHVAEQQILVAELAGEVVGLAISFVRHISGGPVKERDVLFVDSMAVEERYRGQGIGHELFGALLQLCRERGYDGLELQVNARNQAARAMYEKYGFTEKSVNMEFLGIRGQRHRKEHGPGAAAAVLRSGRGRDSGGRTASGGNRPL